MRIRVAVVEVVDAEGQRWLVEIVPSGGEQGAVDVKAEPGYRDPAPVEITPGVVVQPPSEVDGTWQIGLKGVEEVRCHRADGSSPAVSQPLAASGGSPGLPVTPTRSEGAHRGSQGVERHGALVIETRGPWAEDERPGLAEIRGVTDWGPWAQHNFPCPVCKERPAIVDLAGWIFGPCPGCAARGWELSCGRKRWWDRLTRRRA